MHVHICGTTAMTYSSIPPTTNAGLITQLLMEGRKDEALEVAEFNADVGLPVTFDEVHLDVSSPNERFVAVMDLCMGPLCFFRDNIDLVGSSTSSMKCFC